MKQAIYLLAIILGIAGLSSPQFIYAQTTLDSALVVTTIEGEEEDTTSNGTSTWTFNQSGTTVTVNDSISTEYEDVEEFLDDVFGGHPKGLQKFIKSFSKFGWIYALLPILMFFVFPLLILFLILFFIYKGRKAKYKAYEKMAESGQPIPQETMARMSQGMAVEDYKIRNEGLRDVCVGIGLAIFLGIIMDEFGIGIGALVTFIGLGKLLIWYVGEKDKNK